MDLVVFVCAAAMVLVGAVGVIVRNHPVHAALSLVLTLFGVAVLFILQEAEFLAAVQVIVYSGAIVVLFLIVVTLLPSGGSEQLGAGRLVPAVIAGGAVFIVLMSALSSHLQVGVSIPAIYGPGPSVKEVGAPLFSTLLLPFELTAPLLLASIVTAIALWRRQEKPRAGGLG
jgi:NADH-quinone oxidoreductase subunit J